MKLGILLSGRGSNMVAISDAIFDCRLDADIVAVLSDNPEAKGLALARERGYFVQSFSAKSYDSKVAYESEVRDTLTQRGVEWVVLAGYMRLLGTTLLTAFSGRILNIHPSLLPHFKGLFPQRQALESGHVMSGCTVHLVTEELDSGPILGQRSVPILSTDTEQSLAERILMEEHQLYPEVLQSISVGKCVID